VKYVMLMMGTLVDERSGESEDEPGVEELIAFDAELERAGVLAEGDFGLDDPEQGTSLSRASRDAEPVVTAGPYAESREFVGGATVIDVPSLDDALAWAAKCPGAIGGRVEVRPMLEL